MECLSDPAKRELYDQCGGSNENEQYAQAASRGGAPFGRHPQEMSPEELFNMFFQGGVPPGMAGGVYPGGFRFHFGGMPRQQQQQPSLMHQLVNFLPIVLLFLMSFSPFSGGPPERVYSFAPDQVYKNHRETKMNGVTPNIPYYVSDKFRQRYGRSTAELYRVEKSVEQEWHDLTLNRCLAETQTKKKRLARAQWDRLSSEEVERIKAESLPSCEDYRTYFRSEPRFY